MLENITNPLNQNRTIQNLVILAAVTAAVALFIMSVSNLGLLRFGSSTELVPSSGSVVLHTDDFKFVQGELRIPAGSEVQFALINNDVLPHSFDVDELDLHIAMPANDSTETTVTFSEPGAYTFYCAIPGHRAAGMVGTLVIE